MKNMRMLVCLTASAAVWAMGCGAPAEESETPAAPESSQAQPEPGVTQQAAYSVCWSALGVYQSPSTSSLLLVTLHHDHGDYFDTDSSVFMSNGENWVRGTGFCGDANTNCFAYGYVRWAGLCH